MRHFNGEPRPANVTELEDVMITFDFCCQGADVELRRHGMHKNSQRQFATAVARDQFGSVITTADWDSIEELEEAFADLGVSDFKRT